MGVPALFRWLSQKYPKIISKVVEETPQIIDGQEVPIDTTGQNPNGEEFDNLYLDMNGIVHPCSHPEDRPAPETEAEMMLAIFKYTDRVVNMVRPRKILLIAIDGVAPRAKMNQQRSRRFRSVQENKEKDEDKEELLKMLRSQNGGVTNEGTEEAMKKKTWDSNAITPGTPFMFTLSASLQYWCAYKANTDPAWEKLKVIISDASVPGEGEHKIMDFVRSQRASPQHDPNTRHVIYGLDADLIMLGLATHEPHFRVLREDVFFQESKGRTCRICGQKGHIADECKGEAKQKNGEFDERDDAIAKKPFIWLHVSILREYLEAELHIPDQPFRFDLERALDDWVFMCFFVGNDFLPHLPSLDIRENGIDTLMAIWRDNIPLMGGYVTKDGQVDLAKCQYILDGLAKQEDAIFKRRKQTEERRDANAKRRKLEEQNRNGNGRSVSTKNSDSGRRRSSPDYGKASRPSAIPPPDLPLFAPGKGDIDKNFRAITHEMVVNRGAIYKANVANKSAAAVLKGKLLAGGTANGNSDAQESEIIPGLPDEAVNDGNETPETPLSALGKRKADLLEADESSTPGRSTPDIAHTPKADSDEPPPDNVRLWEDGYADRYYETKFGADPKDIAFRNKVAAAYVEGLAWVLAYYSQGCPSWTWFYPYHYAPFAADFVNLAEMKIVFDKSKPIKPYEQLMSVMPAGSNHTIPEPFRSLMTDEDSEIIDFYPEEFPIDLNGKKFAWQGVALLPFIDGKRLLDAMNKRYPLLTEGDHARNQMGKDILIISDRHPLYEDVAANFYSKRQGAPKYNLNVKLSEGLAGKVEKNPDYTPQSQLVFPLENVDMPSLEEDHSISLHYEIPRSGQPHKSMLLRGVKFPPPTLDRADIEGTKAKARSSGRSYGGAPLRHNGYGNGNGNNNGYNRGGNIHYADSRDSRPNPFAAYVNVNQQPPTGNQHQQGRPPPPPGAGWRPPHGQNYNQGPPQHDNGYQQRYSGPPPPAHGYTGYAPPGWNSGYVQPPPPPHYNGYDGRR